MRFRNKFPALQFVSSLCWAFFLGCNYIARHSPLQAVACVVLSIATMLQVAGHFFIWWQVNDAGILQRKLWTTRFTPWTNITRVTRWRPEYRSYRNHLQIDFDQTTSSSSQGRFILNPTQRDQLLQTLKTHAPQATFDI